MANDNMNDLPDSVLNRPDGGIKFGGKVPPQMQKALDAVKASKGQKAPAGPGRHGGQKEEKSKFFQSEWNSLARPQGSQQLENLIDTLKEKSAVYEEIELPSRGKFYNGENGPVNGLLHIRPMTGEEEQILATPKFVKKGQAINMIFKRCMREQFNPEDLLSQDRTFVLIWLRGISYSPEYEIEVRCPDTDNKFNTTVNLSEDIMVNYCPEGFDAEKLSDKLPSSGFNFRYRMSRGSDETAVQKYRDWYLKKNGDDGQDDTMLYRTALLLEEIEGLTEKGELMMLLKKLPIQDVNYLRNVMNDPPFGVDTKITVYSPYSMNEFQLDLPLEANFFFPRQRQKKAEKQLQNSQET